MIRMSKKETLVRLGVIMDKSNVLLLDVQG